MCWRIQDICQFWGILYGVPRHCGNDVSVFGPSLVFEFRKRKPLHCRFPVEGKVEL